MLATFIILWIACLCTIDFLWLFYYESYWGAIASTFSLFASFKSVQKPMVWQQTAIIASEISLSLNFCMTILFWGIVAPLIFTDQLEWHGVDLFLRVQLTLLHSLPLIFTFANVALTDMTFLKADWKILLATGLSYIFANCLGTLALGHPLYPHLDWQDPVQTLSIFIFKAALMSSLHLLCSWLTQKRRN